MLLLLFLFSQKILEAKSSKFALWELFQTRNLKLQETLPLNGIGAIYDLETSSNSIIGVLFWQHNTA